MSRRRNLPGNAQVKRPPSLAEDGEPLATRTDDVYRRQVPSRAEPQHVLIERLGQEAGHCACCGNESRSVWGLVRKAGRPCAAYWMHWTVGRLADHDAHLDLVLGDWGEGATPDGRLAVALLHRQDSDGQPALMVIDAATRPFAQAGLAGTALARAEVIGTPLAAQVFALTDAIYEQDGRFF